MGTRRFLFLALGFTAVLLTVTSGPALALPIPCSEVCTESSACDEFCYWRGAYGCAAYGVPSHCGGTPPPAYNAIYGTTGSDTLNGTANADPRSNQDSHAAGICTGPVVR